jgi:hypothetical protein
MRERDARMITDVTRLVEHHLVARIHERAESDIQRLTHADGHKNFVLGAVADVKILFNVAIDGAAQFDEAEVRGVMRFALFQRVNGGLADVPRRIEVGSPMPSEITSFIFATISKVADA